MNLDFKVVCGIQRIFEVCAIFLSVNVFTAVSSKFSGVGTREKIDKS